MCLERWDPDAETYFVRKKDGTEVRVPARGVRHGKVIPDRPAHAGLSCAAEPDRATDQEVTPMSDELPTSLIRLRLGQEDAHYGGNLVAGATQLKIVGDLITELAMRYDGDEGLFRAYESVEFLAPLYAGDWIEAQGRS